MPPRRALLAVPFALLALASPASAAEVVIGSNVYDPSVSATMSHADGKDWVAWNTALPGDGLVQSPVQGEINSVRVKGFMRLEGRDQRPPDVPGYGSDVDVILHVVVLRPQPDGSVKRVAYSVSEDLPLPLVQDPNNVVEYTRSHLTKPDGADGKGGTRLCIEKGDYIGYAPTGGFGGNANENPEQIYVDGAHFQVFGASRAVSSLHEQGGEFTDDPFTGKSQGGRELLLQATIGTGRDARYTCRTAEEKAQNLDATPTPAPIVNNPYTVPAPVGRATLVKPRKSPKVKGKKVKLALKCSSAGACSGTVALRTYASAKRFSLAAGQTGRVTLTINKKARKKLKRRGSRLTVKAMLVSSDGYKQNLRFKIKRA